MSYQLELRHLHYFKAVAEELHFRRAAEKLFISQPGLSRQIKQMENLLEVELFSRNKRKVQLTPAGHYLKKETDFIFNHLKQTQQHIKKLDKGEEGELTIGFVGSAMQTIIPKLLVTMNTHFPNTHMNFEEISNLKQVEAIQSNALDLGFVRLDQVPNDIQIKTVFNDTFSVVLPQKHFLTHDNFKSMKQLEEENFILFSKDYSPLYYQKIMSIFEDQGFEPNISHRSVHAQTIFTLVENGLGIAVVPTSLQKGFNLKVKFLEIPNIRQQAVLSIIWNKKNRNPVLHNILKTQFLSLF
ncbi:HTH-type transcriptional regulator AlsR [Flavobacteriaceae bacterium UJ101]|nr:HTH-type transcriptional regulator AlsR [Flavobacteriaceae bacterium UJ101]